MMCDNEDENGRPRPALQLWCRSSREPGTRRARNTGPVCLSLLCKMPDTNSRVHVPIWSPEGSASFELALAVRSAARSARMHARSGRRSVLGTAKMCLGRHTPRLNRDSALVGGESTVSCQWKHTPGRRCVGSDVQNERLSRARRAGGLVVLGEQGRRRKAEHGGGSGSGCGCGWCGCAGWLYVGWELEVGWSIAGSVCCCCAVGWAARGVDVRVLRLPVFMGPVGLDDLGVGVGAGEGAVRVRYSSVESAQKQTRKWRQATAAVAGTNLGGAKPHAHSTFRHRSGSAGGSTRVPRHPKSVTRHHLTSTSHLTSLPTQDIVRSVPGPPWPQSLVYSLTMSCTI